MMARRVLAYAMWTSRPPGDMWYGYRMVGGGAECAFAPASVCRGFGPETWERGKLSMSFWLSPRRQRSMP